MIKITKDQYLLRQPAFPEETPTDGFFFNLANELLADCEESGLFAATNPEVLKRAALCVIGYFQDIISDGGLWRGFISECRRLYGEPVPFHVAGEDYVEFELNEQDVQFLVWYAMAMLDEEHPMLSPHDDAVLALGTRWFRLLDERYDEAPVPEGFNITYELDVYDPEDKKAIARLSQWLFMHSWLVTPSFALTLSQLAQQARITEEGGDVRMQDLLEEAMGELPVGPLALFMREWIYLILHDKMPPKPRRKKAVAEEHKYYRKTLEFSGGREILYFADYEALNDFFIKALGWDENEDHLPQMKSGSDFVVMVNREKGMLLARDVAKCIADPDNPLYDKKVAETRSISLLTQRGLCPPDLLTRILAEGWLPDARFPGHPGDSSAVTFADFIARCYLQLYYRGD